MALDRAVRRLKPEVGFDQLAVEPLVRSLPVVVFREVMDELAKVALAERNDSVQTFGLMETPSAPRAPSDSDSELAAARPSHRRR